MPSCNLARFFMGLFWLMMGEQRAYSKAASLAFDDQQMVLYNLILAEVVPIWNRWDVILFGVLFLVFISLGSYGLGMNIRDKRKQELERQVKERTEALERANDELQLRNTELDRFVYSASHDLSSPLKSILGLIHVARLENPEPRQLEYLDMMEKSVDRLQSFIDEVIQYSRNSRMPVQLENFDFNGLVSSILNDYKYLQNFDKISFQVVDEVKHTMTADGMRLKIILNNLVSNAIKFQKSNGRPEIKISLKRDVDNYLISVADNGRGIQDEYLDKIFEMFFRATEETQGSGLGLYILKEAVSKLGGRIEVQSKVGQGTVFNVTLPIRKLA